MYLVISMDNTVFDIESKPRVLEHVMYLITYRFLPIQPCMGYVIMYLNFRATSRYG